MIKTDVYRQKIRDLTTILTEAGYSLDTDKLRVELQDLKKEQENPDIWSDLEKSKIIAQKIRVIENKLNAYDNCDKIIKEALDVIEFAEMEDDDSLLPEIEKELTLAENNIEQIRLQTLLKGKYDGLNAIMNLHAGAGGTEACDWCEMLYRMFMCYAEKHDYNLVEMDRLEGDGAGIKSVSFRVEGTNAYGFLKAEKGVHRLVRISPFDANKRRHTSFVSVEVMPEIIDNEEIVIPPEDLKVDTYRSSGAGGQHVNKTESAIRITHIPTGIIVACQNERSQIQNREQAMKMLMSKLVEKREADRLAEEQELKGDIKKIEWGSQIRSYVFCPYTLVKDHRTGSENSNVQAVMDGEIDQFIVDYLKKS